MDALGKFAKWKHMKPFPVVILMGHSADQRAFPARLCANETEDTHAIEA